MAYLEIAPNGKLPLKKHEQSILNEHHDHGKLWDSVGADTNMASKIAGIIRTWLVKYRELVQYPPKMRVIKSQAVLYIYIYMDGYFKLPGSGRTYVTQKFIHVQTLHIAKHNTDMYVVFTKHHTQICNISMHTYIPNFYVLYVTARLLSVNF